MAESPPKRMTRARAAKAADETSSTAIAAAPVRRTKAPVTTKIATGAVKIAVDAAEASVAATKPKASAPRRKAKIEPDIEASEVQPSAQAAKKPAVRRKVKPLGETAEQSETKLEEAAPKPTRGRPRKTAPKEPNEQEAETVPVPAKPITKSATTRAVRTRPTRAAVTKTLEDPFVESTENDPVRKTTRSRAAATAMTKSVAAKKKVAFEDEAGDSDKENRVPVPPKRKTEPVLPKTGIRAKPVRKAAAAAITCASTTRATRRPKATAAAATVEPEEAQIVQKEDAPKPLSPKKITQVGATPTEEESQRPPSSHKSPSPIKASEPQRPLSPVRALSLSPRKNPSPIKVAQDAPDSNLPKIDTVSCCSPPPAFTASLLSSPARRVPTSPFKDAMKESAKKPADRGFHESILSRQPFKAPISGPLFQPVSSTSSALTPSFKSSLLGTPARRLPQTASKLTSFATPVQAPLFRHKAPATVGPQVHTVHIPDSRSIEIETASSGFKSRSPIKTPKVHNITPPSTSLPPQVEDAKDEDVFASLPEEGIGSMSTRAAEPTPLAKQTTNVLKSAMKSAKRPHFSASDSNVSPTKVVKIDERSPTRHAAEIDANETSSASSMVVEEPVVTSVMTPEKQNKRYSFAFDTPATQYPSDCESENDDTAVTRQVPFTPNKKVFDLTSNVKNKRRVQSMSAPKQDSSANGQEARKASKRKANSDVFGELAASEAQSARNASLSAVSMTPLLNQLGSWKRTSPEKAVREARQEAARDLFAFNAPASPSMAAANPEPEALPKAEAQYFEEEIIVDETPLKQSRPVTPAQIEVYATPELSPASQIYGDENVPPMIDPALLALDQPAAATNEQMIDSPMETAAGSSHTTTVTPARVFALGQAKTASKVPPKSTEDQSLDRSNPKRRQSLSGPVSPRKLQSLAANGNGVPKSQSAFVVSSASNKSPPKKKTTQGSRPSTVLTAAYATPNRPRPGPLCARSVPSPTFSSYEACSPYSTTSVGTSEQEAAALECAQSQIQTPESKLGSPSWTAPWTPYAMAATPGTRAPADTLKGATIFVDVHTAEGADASGIFVELLGAMGARCVKSWAWNPRASLVAAEGTPVKVGITHVVFKDGGKRTLEKVNIASRLGVEVKCVGVGWVLDCEQSQSHLPESPYQVDTSSFPRGGHRRRKSMEPKAAIASMLPPTTPSVAASIPLPPATDSELSFLHGGTPAAEAPPFTFASPTDAAGRPMRRRSSSVFVRTPARASAAAPSPLSQAETPWDPNRWEDLPPLPAEPVTPGPPLLELTKGLTVKTCVPKEKKAGFPESGRLEDFEGGEQARRKLALARKRSLQFVPKVGSPLAKLG